ncbi:MAG: M28 family peptidase, partial [Gemmatimonadetes bacterium]|nr:M28 family peptidase [Gemmatimonadota bacterium]
SMMGRQTGTPGHLKATVYIEAQVRRLGLKPAGDNGGFFQNVPVAQRWMDASSTITVGGTTLAYGKDFAAGGGRGEPRPIDGAEVIFGGPQGDTANPLTAEQVRGKLVVMTAPAGGGRGGGFGAFGGRGGGAAAALAEAAGIATVVGEQLPPQLAVTGRPRPGQGMTFLGALTPAPSVAMTLSITAKAAEALLGVPVSQATKGMAGRTIKAALKMDEAPVPARNVVGILQGSDPKLKGEYVAIGAHNDHIGMRAGTPVDHDSLHLYNEARYAITGMLSRGQQPSPEQMEAVRNIHINLDSVRKLRPVRLDSISNGADDDGSGTVTVLEIAERFAKLPKAQRPKRSLLFVWHVGEENGLWGSQYVTDHPPVPRDSIVAQLNMDMVGRGEKSDLPVGGPDYLQLVGSRRLSTELGDLMETVNKAQKMPFRFDYQFDANGHPENIYCRSDHYNYARYCIPVVFATTGLHGDYHQVTDEPQYIAYDHMARVGNLMYDMAVRVADLDHRPLVDKPKPDPKGRC